MKENKKEYRKVSKSLKELAKFLEENDAFSIVKLDGFLAAIVSGPSLIMPSEWMKIAGVQNITFESEQQANHMLSTLMDFYNSIIRLFDKGQYKPLLTLDGLRSLKEYSDWKQVARNWAEGYLEGIGVDAENWLSIDETADKKTDEKKLPTLLFFIFALKMDEKTLYEELKHAGIKKEPEEIWQESIELLPSLSNAIYEYWIDQRETGMDISRQVRRRGYEKISRNAPCPCGSGKKYKKCCMETIH